MTKRRSIRTVLGVAALSGSFALVGWGCSDNTEEKLRAAKLAQGCSINSDCVGDLVCVFERCHVACNEDEDCADPLRCVRGLDGGANVCQLDDEVGCERDRDCPGEQVCGADDECRDSCRDDDECIGAQICAASDECASTDPEKDELDAEGNIVPAGSATGGAAGASGVGGASSTGGSPDSGGAGGTLGAAGEGGSAGVSSGSAGEASGGSDSGPPDEYVESSDGVEAVNNDDREHALPASPKSSLFFTVGDQDWLAVSTPDDGRAHVIELGLQQESGLRTGVEALAGVDFASIGLATTQAGVTTKVYITVGPATTTLLRFWPYGGISGETGKRLELTIQTSPEQDDHEPNNTRETATSIELNTQITAWLVNPFVSATDKAIDDWYAVELTEGMATLALLEVPSAGRVAITRENEQGVVAAIQTPQVGVTGEWPIAVPVTGTYLIHFTAYTGFLPFVEGLKPSHLAQPYKFEVRQ